HLTVDAFVKNAGLGFAIPYLHNGQPHDYMPGFIIRLKADPPVHLILETKGYDPVADVKKGAAERWVRAVNADGSYGKWAYEMVRQISEVDSILNYYGLLLLFARDADYKLSDRSAVADFNGRPVFFRVSEQRFHAHGFVISDDLQSDLKSSLDLAEQ